MENNNRQGCRWTKDKPKFEKECVLVTASKYNRNSEAIDYDYTIWQIKQIDSEDDDGNSAWYLGLLNGDGEEYGALEDLEADYYTIIPSPESIEPCATSSESCDEKDLIIQGIEEGSQQWKEEYDSARKIIEQLVEQSGILYTYGSRIEGIYQKFPELLKAAKEFLSKYQHQ
jgi:hypothetical protein